MADWIATVTFHFAPFDPLIPVFEGLLIVLQVVEAVLEAFLEIIQIFLLALLSPIIAAVYLILAAIELLLDQIAATGFSILLVHPDFSQADITGVFNSVSGAYPGFETKVVGKFYDTADVFRPMYPDGSAVAMLILYIGADSPGDLLGLIFELLYLLKHPLQIQLPAPVAVTARPVTQTEGSAAAAVTQFASVFSPDLQKAVALQWRMPDSPAGSGLTGLIGQATSLYTSFSFPSFIVERTDALNPRGQLVSILPDTSVLGNSVNPILDRYSFPAVKTKYLVRDWTGSTYRDFGTKIRVDGASLVEGNLTGTYTYIDNDPALVQGATYYYRIRAFFGEPTQYLALKSPDDVIAAQNTLLFRSGVQWYFRTEPGVTLGKASAIVKGVVPVIPTGDFDPYNDLNNAVKAGILLNFDFPQASSTDNVQQQQQKTGWGTLTMIGGQMGPLKAAYNTSDQLKNAFLFTSMSRRLSNMVLDKLYAQPTLLQNLTDKWTAGVNVTVNTIINTTDIWSFIGIIGGITTTSGTKINAYLALENNYTSTNTSSPFKGPYPISPAIPGGIAAQQRKDLADFLRLALALLSFNTSYLHWYSVTLGDLLPDLRKLLNWLEQFILALLKAIQDAVKEITEIIQTLIQKVVQLEQLVQTILDILAILSIDLTVSVFVDVNSAGSADQLASDLQASTDKPGDSPFGLHSGLVITAGGPGTGIIDALSFIFGF